jgi:hypothetical protein
VEKRKVGEFAHLCVRAKSRWVKVVVAMAARLLFWNKLREIAAEPPRANKSARLKKEFPDHTATASRTHRYCLPLSRRRLDFEPLQVDEDGKE